MYGLLFLLAVPLGAIFVSSLSSEITIQFLKTTQNELPKSGVTPSLVSPAKEAFLKSNSGPPVSLTAFNVVTAISLTFLI